MALNAHIVSLHVVELRRIDDVGSALVRDVLAARPVASLAAHIPFRDFLGSDVVVHRVTTVAQRSGRPLEIIGRIVLRPPVRAVLYEIGPPNLVGHVPLRGKHEIIVADLLEIALLPFAAIGEGNVVFREGQ